MARCSAPIPCAAYNAEGDIFAYAESYDWSKGAEAHNPATAQNSIFLHKPVVRGPTAVPLRSHCSPTAPRPPAGREPGSRCHPGWRRPAGGAGSGFWARPAAVVACGGLSVACGGLLRPSARAGWAKLQEAAPFQGRLRWDAGRIEGRGSARGCPQGSCARRVLRWRMLAAGGAAPRP